MTSEEFSDAYSRSFKSTVRFLVSRGLSYDAALDAAQDGWAKGWQYREQLRDLNLLSTWVNSIALNVARNFRRSKDSKTATLPAVLPGRPLNVAAIDARRMMSMVDARRRGVLSDYYIAGYSLCEMAERYGCSEAAARIRLLRARQAARKRLSKRAIL
jgi:RNA polymerase sigma factor (sigma-70 family)